MPVFFLFVVSALISERSLPKQSYKYTLSSLISIFLSRFFHNLGWGLTAKPALRKNVPGHSPAGPGRQDLT